MMSDVGWPKQVEFEIPYTLVREGPTYFTVRLILGEPPAAAPDEVRIEALIAQAYINGYLLRQRYDDHMRRVTRLIFKRRRHYPYPPSDDFFSHVKSIL